MWISLAAIFLAATPASPLVDASKLTLSAPAAIVELDTGKREVTPPKDLVKALKAADAIDAWRAMSFTHQREHVEAIEQAKKPETRTRRIERALEMVTAKKRRRP